LYKAFSLIITLIISLIIGLFTFRFVDANGFRYEGDFVYGERCGYGVQQTPDGCLYEVNFRNGRINGRGIATTPLGILRSFVYFIFIYLFLLFTINIYLFVVYDESNSHIFCIFHIYLFLLFIINIYLFVVYDESNSHIWGDTTECFDSAGRSFLKPCSTFEGYFKNGQMIDGTFTTELEEVFYDVAGKDVI
jgi:hypothetical protein